MKIKHVEYTIEELIDAGIASVKKEHPGILISIDETQDERLAKACIRIAQSELFAGKLRRIAAIRAFRFANDLSGLAEARDIIDHMAVKMGIMWNEGENSSK
jgi:hypothetical protein